MIIKSLGAAEAFTAGDGSTLRELLHPDRGPSGLGYSLAQAVVGAGGATRPHRLKASEVYYILEGRGRMHVGSESSEVAPGQAVYIPAGSIQFIENIGASDLAFLCIVDPAWTAADEEIL